MREKKQKSLRKWSGESRRDQDSVLFCSHGHPKTWMESGSISANSLETGHFGRHLITFTLPTGSTGGQKGCKILMLTFFFWFWFWLFFLLLFPTSLILIFSFCLIFPSFLPTLSSSLLFPLMAIS